MIFSLAKQRQNKFKTKIHACLAAILFLAGVIPLWSRPGPLVNVSALTDSARGNQISNNSYPGHKIATIAKQYIGLPYKYGGTSPDTGFDCSGFTGYVYGRVGYKLGRGADDQYDSMKAVKVPLVGDLVFFNIDGKRVSHVGIYLGDFKFIHSPRTGKNIGIADIRIDYWKKRYAGARSLFH